MNFVVGVDEEECRCRGTGGEAGRISDTADRGQVGQTTHPVRDREGEEFKGKDRTDRRKMEWK